MSDNSLPAWYRTYKEGTNPDMCGGGNKTGYRCASYRKSKCRNCSRPVICTKWVKASRKCGKKKSSPRKPSPSSASRRQSRKPSRRRQSRKPSRRRKPCKRNQVRSKSTGRCRKKSAKKSRRRKSAKKSRRRKSPKRKSPKRKSPKRKSSKARKSSDKGCVDMRVHGTPSEQKKYGARKSPPYPAAACEGMIKEGNDGNNWEAKKSGKSVRWVRVKTE